MQQKNKISFSIGGSIGNSFSGAVGGAIKKLDRLSKEEESIKDKQTLIRKFRADDGAAARLAKKLRNQQAALTDLQTKYNASGGASEKLKLRISDLESDISDTTQALQKQNKTVNATKTNLTQAGIDVHNLTGEEKNLKEALDKNDKAMQKRSATFRKIGSSVSFLKRSFVGATVAGLGLAAAGNKLTNEFTEHGFEVSNVSTKLGMTTTALQRLRYAAQQTGMTSEELDGSLEEMSIRLNDAVQGGGQATQALQQIGLSAQELNNLKPEQAIGLIADAISKVHNQKKRVWLADALFGGQGVAMLNMLDKGAKGINELGDQAERTGFVLSEQSIKSALVGRQAFMNMMTSFKSIAWVIGAALTPMMTKAFTNISKWVSNNQDTIKQWGKNVAYYFGKVGESIKWLFGDSTSAQITKWTAITLVAVHTITKAIKVLNLAIKRNLFVLAGIGIYHRALNG